LLDSEFVPVEIFGAQDNNHLVALAKRPAAKGWPPPVPLSADA
jgi:hypothetical protein